MEILGIGIDLVEIGRMEKAIARHEEFVSRVFSPREKELCEDYARPARRYAACFAAKEAASKALGSGMMGFAWQEVEMLRDDKGQPYLVLSGRAQELASSKGVDEILISVSHSRGLAVAVAQAVGGEVEI
jgi:holo-[acyl-carrier protein] synthase